MKQYLLAIILLAAMPATGIAQTREDYDTAVSRFQRYYNAQQPDSIFSMLSEKVQNTMPRAKTVEKFNLLYLQLGEMIIYQFANEKSGYNYYRVQFAHGPLNLAVILNPEKQIEAFRFVPVTTDTAEHEKSNFILNTPDGALYGSLTLPAGMGKVPVVMIIAGSGPTDRNGNNPMGVSSNAYKMIADSLLNNGIGCLRFDKRGVGESSGALKSEETLRFDDMIADAKGFTELLQKHFRVSKIFILGHSEGSLIGMPVAAQEKVAGYISVAGAGEPADKIVDKQLRRQSKEVAKQAKVIMDSIKNGYVANDIPTDLQGLLRPSVQGYIRSWIKYDPRKEIKKLDMPVLIIQGTTDQQVDEKNATMLKKAKKTATLDIIEGMNHVLKQAPEDPDKNLATYSNPTLPLCPGFMLSLLRFIAENK
jgi:alpha-beta hydrolase superfamily lysophospholipase